MFFKFYQAIIMLRRPGLSLVVAFCLAAFFILNSQAQGNIDVGTAVTFSCGNTEAEVAARNGPRVSHNGQTIYIGYQQVSSNNKDPIAVSFSNGGQDWCRTDYETSGDDNTGYGLYWNGQPDGLYAAFSVTGTQGASSTDFRRFATNSWLRSYTDGSPGGGGGAKAAIVARLNPTTGDVLEATFITALLSSGRTNSLTVTDLELSNTVLRVNANSWYSPRNPDKSRMDCSGSSPFDYELYLSPDLSTALYATAENCVGNAAPLAQRVRLQPRIAFVGSNTFTAFVEPTGLSGSFTYTWAINGSIVQRETSTQPLNQLRYTWPTTAAAQTLQVSVTHALRQSLGLADLDSDQLQFDVVTAQQLYLPLLVR